MKPTLKNPISYSSNLENSHAFSYNNGSVSF